MTAMEGEGRAPKPSGPHLPSSGQDLETLPVNGSASSSRPRSKVPTIAFESFTPSPPAASGEGAGETSGMRDSFASVDLDDVEMVPASVSDPTDGIDIEFEDGGGQPGSVDKLLAMTGEVW